ncbi:hypothetical protein ACEQPO_10770 [Bacillus sp. SL00103]
MLEWTSILPPILIKRRNEANDENSYRSFCHPYADRAHEDGQHTRAKKAH